MAIKSLQESLKELGKEIEDLSENMVRQARQSVQTLAAQAHSMIVAKAQEKLGSRRSIYIDALNIEKIYSDNSNEIWAVTLDKSAGWIEDGLPRRNMIESFLASPKAKVNKKGEKYLVIPFELLIAS